VLHCNLNEMVFELVEINVKYLPVVVVNDQKCVDKCRLYGIVAEHK